MLKPFSPQLFIMMWIVPREPACIWWQKIISNSEVLSKRWPTVCTLSPTPLGSLPLERAPERMVFSWVEFSKEAEFQWRKPWADIPIYLPPPVLPPKSSFIAYSLKGKWISSSITGKWQTSHLASHCLETWATFCSCHLLATGLKSKLTASSSLST